MQIKVFGTQEDRTISARIHEIVELVDEQPAPAEAVRRIPPASATPSKPRPSAARRPGSPNSANLFEQETRNGNHASE